MTTKLICNLVDPPIGGLAASELIKSTNPITIEWSNNESLITFSTHSLTNVSNNDILRALARDAPKYQLYGKSPIERTQIDHWLTFSLSYEYSSLAVNLAYLNKCLAPITFLVANKFTIADLAVFNELYHRWSDLKAIGIPNHVQRWYNLIIAQPSVEQVLKNLPQNAKRSDKPVVQERKQEGKFIDLPGAEMGKVVVRFPPEASGYLHIGHAKAALLNQYYQQAFQGKLIMRFDDTNPAKENVHFEQVILGDLKMLEIEPDLFTHTSQYFDLMLQYCEQLMREGKAYVDDTEPEQMKDEREKKVESKNRSNSVEKNFQMWKEMVAGSAAGQKCCVRAKIDMQSPNGCMRDPTIYRCKNEPHPRTGTQYKVYPTYDFACPIVDAIENVTHTLRTMEYHDRDAQFYWFIDALKLRKPYIWEYSRLNMTNTVLSKRKLTWFVEEGLVDGWDDPRFPTVRGILRRGMTVAGLKEFIIAQGSSKSVVFMEWDKIWAFNKKVIDPIAPRYTALEAENRVTVYVAGAKLEKTEVPTHPKNTEIGTKTVLLGPKIFIDYVDAIELKEGENATFINWGNLMIKKINKNSAGKITSIDAALNLEDKDFKKTLKLTWLCELPQTEFPPTVCVYFDHIVSKPVLGKDEDFKQFIGHETRKDVQMLGDPELKKLKKGDIIQLQRRGYFKVDCAYQAPNEFSSVESPVVLFSIPDGHTKDNVFGNVTAKVTQEKKSTIVVPPAVQSASTGKANEINEKIVKQGDLIRDLKAKKATKDEITKEVNVLLALKAEYKTATGQEWKPGTTTAAPQKTETKSVANVTEINDKIVKQGDLIRNLKANKASKDEITKQVNTLLALKAEYKSISGQDWKPEASPATATPQPPQPAEVKPAASNASEINDKIIKQGDLVRDLKAKKAGKDEITKAVNILLALKAEYKSATGQDWKPGTIPAAQKPAEVKSTPNAASNQLNDKIVKQGDLIRNLKASKASKDEITQQVNILLALKADYKTATGEDWKPLATTPAVVQTQQKTMETKPTSNAAEINEKIVKQGNLVRDLKAKKASKGEIDKEVTVLKALKEEYKTAIGGQEWKPAESTPKVQTNKENLAPVSAEVTNLTKKITEQANKVTNLKSCGVAKTDIEAADQILLGLKAEYKKLTGRDFPPPGSQPTPQVQQQQQQPKAQKPQQQSKKDEKKPKKEPTPPKTDDGGAKKQTRLGLEAKKEENLADWYSQVITKGEMIEYYDVSGCYILRHWSFAIWKVIKNWFDAEITRRGVKECYFPIFVSRAALEKEKDHIADFAPEVAWVTKSGESDLAEPIAVRPTSETVMYPAYAKWIQSYRDLPIKLNQWNNVVRWEFKHPQPFIRTREFLWQEGHTAYATAKEAEDEVLDILDLYAKVYTDLLAIPVIKGRKTEKEKFAGGDYTTTVEAFVSASGRGIQGATSHYLGQNFSKMFDIVYEDPETKNKEYVHQNSWGITTRTIGVMIMIHADNQGLVLPPQVASIQVIIVPCGIVATTTDDERKTLVATCMELEKELIQVGVRVEGDYRDNYSPGWKYNHWELKGVPIRIELGFKDMKNNQFVAVRRDTGVKTTITRAKAATEIPELLKTIHQSMLAKADKDLTDHLKITKNWSEFCKFLDAKNIIMAPFCGEIPCEEKIKADSARDDSENVEPGAPAMGAKSLCIPFKQPTDILPNDKCIHSNCSKKPKFYTLFGRSY
uniref:Bifunctional glutamate/proline--tRNA ligase n=1 Tax=Corethrella appendiculata TaxID=1370023 RepID=W4VRQ8_9DIPT